MTEIVISRCYGGFGLSEKAIQRYAELAGLTLYPEDTRFSFTTWWLVPENERPPSQDSWASMSDEERIASNKAYSETQFYDRDLARDDPILVRAVKELGDEANAAHASLEIVEIPDGVGWQVEEYDGNEWVAEKHRTW